MKRKKTKTRSDTSTKQRSKGKEIAKRNNRKAKEGSYEGIGWESGCELACLHWLHHLKSDGFVKVIERSPSFLLSDAYVHNYSQVMKRGSRPMQQTLMNGHSYTADYKVTFTRKAIGKFVWMLGSSAKHEKYLMVAHDNPNNPDECIVYIEVKPDFSFQGKTEKSVNDMKWTWQKHGIWINLWKPNKCFASTFCPIQYVTTERGIRRKLPFEPRSLQDFLKTL